METDSSGSVSLGSNPSPVASKVPASRRKNQKGQRAARSDLLLPPCNALEQDALHRMVVAELLAIDIDVGAED